MMFTVFLPAHTGCKTTLITNGPKKRGHVNRFYLGKVGTGLLKLFTFGGFTIWAIIDIILIALKRLNDNEGYPLA